jgi:hypothetical protein
MGVPNARCCLCVPLKAFLGVPNIGSIMHFIDGPKCNICYHPLCDNCKLPGYNDFGGYPGVASTQQPSQSPSSSSRPRISTQPQYLSTMPQLPPTSRTRTSTASTKVPSIPSSPWDRTTTTQMPNPAPSSRDRTTQMPNAPPSSRRGSTTTITQKPSQSSSSSSRQKSSTKPTRTATQDPAPSKSQSSRPSPNPNATHITKTHDYKVGGMKRTFVEGAVEKTEKGKSR